MSKIWPILSSMYVKQIFTMAAFLSILIILSIGCDVKQERMGQNQSDDIKEALLASGLALSYWDGGKIVGSLKISELSLGTKYLGPFKMLDHCDIEARDFRLVLKCADIDKVLKDIFEAMIRMASANNVGNSHIDKAAFGKKNIVSMINIPPNIIIHSFILFIKFPQGREMVIKADRAELTPPNFDINMEGEVIIYSSPNTILTGENFELILSKQVVDAKNSFILTTNKTQLKGADGRFSFSGGSIKKIASTEQTCDSKTTNLHARPSFPVMMALWGHKKSPSSQVLLSWYMMNLMQAQFELLKNQKYVFSLGNNEPMPHAHNKNPR